MARGNIKTRKQEIAPDRKYDSVLVSKFINYIMKNGKKTVAERICYEAFESASTTLNAEALAIFDQAIKNVGPIVEVKSKRIGGANYQVPVEVSKERKNTLAIRWILEVSRKGSGKPMAELLAAELVAAYHGEGNAIKKKIDTHKMAEANKAFAHFARF